MDVCKDEVLTIVSVLKTVYRVIQLAVPIMLLIFGGLDMLKAVMAGDEKEIKSAQNVLIKRVIAAVIVIVLVIVVKAATGLFGGEDWKKCWDNAENAEFETIWRVKSIYTEM